MMCAFRAQEVCAFELQTCQALGKLPGALQVCEPSCETNLPAVLGLLVDAMRQSESRVWILHHTSLFSGFPANVPV